MTEPDQKFKLAQKQVQAYNVTKRIPLVISYCIDKTISKIPEPCKQCIASLGIFFTAGFAALCVAVPFIYAYQKEIDQDDEE